MNKNLLLLLLLMQSLFNSVQAQIWHGPSTQVNHTARTFGVTDEEGTWEFEVYPGNIIKTIFKPNNYTTNELVSNAVILKPVLQKITVDRVKEGTAMKLGERISLLRKEGIIWYHLDGKLLSVMQGNISKDGYRGFALRLQHEEKIFGGGERKIKDR